MINRNWLVRCFWWLTETGVGLTVSSTVTKQPLHTFTGTFQMIDNYVWLQRIWPNNNSLEVGAGRHIFQSLVEIGGDVSRKKILIQLFLVKLLVYLRFVFTPQVFIEGLMSFLCYLCLLAYSGVQCILIIWVTWQVSYKRQELLTLREHLHSPPEFALLLVFCAVFFRFIYLYPVSCVPNVASISGFSITFIQVICKIVKN